jgi:hypothetical protein
VFEGGENVSETALHRIARKNDAHVDSSRRLYAKSGRSQTSATDGPVETLPSKVGAINGPEAREAGLRLKRGLPHRRSSVIRLTRQGAFSPGRLFTDRYHGGSAATISEAAARIDDCCSLVIPGGNRPVAKCHLPAAGERVGFRFASVGIRLRGCRRGNVYKALKSADPSKMAGGLTSAANG